MKRKTTKLALKRSLVEIQQSLNIYEDGTIVFEDLMKSDYYVFDSISAVLSFINLNYE